MQKKFFIVRNLTVMRKQVLDKEELKGKTISYLQETEYLTFLFFTDDTFCVFDSDKNIWADDEPAIVFLDEKGYDTDMSDYSTDKNKELLDLGFITQAELDAKNKKDKRSAKQSREAREKAELKALLKKYPDVN